MLLLFMPSKKAQHPLGLDRIRSKNFILFCGRTQQKENEKKNPFSRLWRTKQSIKTMYVVTYEKIQRDQEDLEGKEERGTHGETVFVFCLAFVVVVVSCNLCALLLKQRVSLIASCQYDTLQYTRYSG